MTMLREVDTQLDTIQPSLAAMLTLLAASMESLRGDVIFAGVADEKATSLVHSKFLTRTGEQTAP